MSGLITFWPGNKAAGLEIGPLCYSALAAPSRPRWPVHRISKQKQTIIFFTFFRLTLHPSVISLEYQQTLTRLGNQTDLGQQCQTI
jgi:hypothetical protein